MVLLQSCYKIPRKALYFTARLRHNSPMATLFIQRVISPLLALLVLVGTGFGVISSAWDGSISRHNVAKPSPLSLQGQASQRQAAYIQDYVRFSPWNTAENTWQTKELDLWNLEGKKFVRSPAVVSPDQSQMAYSEVMFMPKNRQTYAKLYIVPVAPLQNQTPALPSEGEPPSQLPSPYELQSRYDPNKTLQQRQLVLGVGHDKTLDYDFRTLTIVDWSANGQRLLFKQKSGKLHVGLRTSDLLVYDPQRGAVTIYPEIKRIVENYWATQGNYSHIENIAWDIYPMGWEEGSDSAVLFKAWAFDHNEKKFLGLWRYDVNAERANLVTLTDQFIPVAANGMAAELEYVPLQLPEKEKKWWQFGK